MKQVGQLGVKYSISNIIYNYLNLPEQISVTGKGTIAYTYDAHGEKRSKTVTESGVSVTYKGQTYAGITITTTSNYVNRQYPNGINR